MGKRVNYAARSVISPDPYIMVDEIGFPEIFAKKLTFPEPVNDHNYEELKNLVLNGPDIYPGASSVQMENGTTVRLNPNDGNQREAIAFQVTCNAYSKSNPDLKVKVVNRHLRTGDILLLNRQPTLHKPSIMAHKARVLPGEKTLRLHYANCKCYNADFDGDEMNAHFPQSFLTRAEGYNIVSVNYQYLVPKDGTPLSGLIQDHIVSATMLTYRGEFFTKSDYQNLVYGAICFIKKPIKFLNPSIIKPHMLWSGKQVVSTIILNLIPEGKKPPFLNIASKIKPSILISQKPREFKAGGKIKPTELCESQVIVRAGELLVGLFDKSNLGNTSYGLIHSCYELYGGEVSSSLLTAFARLANNYLQSKCGFTLGIYDILITKKADKIRKNLIKNSTKVGDEAVAKAFNILDVTDKEALLNELQDAHTSSNPLFLKMLDTSFKTKNDETSNNISKECLPAGLLKPFPYNHLQMMIQPGAKGGLVNALQISCLLGQIELEGKRVPMMISGKTLPSFEPYDTSPKAGGFVTGRFLTGICPQEFFFHCMAGREGLIDTAVKTSRSGYLQRCLIKHLEGLVINYDNTVRDSDQSIIQFLYGEDGLDILKSQLLKDKGFSIISKNIDCLAPKKELVNKIKSFADTEAINMQTEDLNDWDQVHEMDRLSRKRGEAVGLLAAQSIGEPSTQMTLNTFHFAGRGEMNVTLEEEDSSSDEEGGDGDADDARTKGTRNQELTYEEPEEEEFEKSDSEEVSENEENIISTEKNNDSENETNEESVIKKERKRINSNLKQDRINSVKAQFPIIDDYDFDDVNEEWCVLSLQFSLGQFKIDLASLIQEETKKAVLYKVGKIDKAFLVKNPNAIESEYESMIKTEGVSFLSLIKFSNYLDLNRVYSNDIHAIANTFGIEAGRKAVVQEMKNVFGVYGIEIDPRHLSLIADYMTFSGVIKGMNRFSINSNSSPIQQITFETSMQFLKNATLLGIKDEISSPSARLFIGRPITAGSGILECLLDNDRNTKYMKQKKTKTDPETPKNKRKIFNIKSSQKKVKLDL
ncbi:hypothetical protein RND71_044190 [Anisodus tanguticus]|uniref:DNA-directed RNA polymerase n=1 Tax=Anisodus tanguticus TaxID=243964 RepID=A0AAE1UTZ3_9SOLA|nr:hypothetical protein RND71_044190 [Anisodus tanguticus]